MSKTTQRIIIGVSAAAVITMLVFFMKDIMVPYIRMELNNDIDGAKELLVSKGLLGCLTVVLVEALQMIVVFIPAEFIQISSGLSYPFYLALLLCDLGVCLGASLIYLLVRVFSFNNDAAAKQEKLIEKIASSQKKDRSTSLLMYLLFIMPLVPFGAICYFASGRRIKYGRYILTVATGVIPSIVTSNLMGAATRYFISNLLPLPVLILIIVGLGALLLASLIFFLNKFYFKENDRTPDSVIYTGIFRVVDILIGKKQRLHFDDALLKDLDGPFVAICNHESFYDFYYLNKFLGEKRAAFVANRHIVTKPGLKKLAAKSAFIPKKLFVPDMVTAVGIRKMLRAGYPVALFPEGRLSITGSPYPIVDDSAGFLKKMKADILLVKIEGAYFANPKWRRRFYRSDINVSGVRIIKAEEAAQMTNEALSAAIAEGISYDESKLGLNKYDKKDMAEGLESILYRCAHCGALYTTKGVGREFICTECGKKLTFDEYYRFDGEPHTIAEYYERIKAMEAEELDGLSLEAAVKTVIFSVKSRYRTRDRGVCRLTKEGFCYASEDPERSFSVGFDALPALPFSCNQEFETYHDDKLYYFYPEENRRQVVRWALIVDLIKEKQDEQKADE